ncbi:glycine cleavage system aminomethyltransferase GcvT [Luteimonas sp. e5]
MTRKTLLNERHRDLGAKMVDFGGWDMPIHYGSQIDEHHQVRRAAGMFDVSHMNVIDVHGAGARDFLRRVLANNIDKLKAPGKALYSCMLNERGGVIDDLIVYWLGDERFRLVANAATRDKDLAWLRRQGEGFDVEIVERKGLAIIAVQGPQARGKVIDLLAEDERERITQLAKFSASDAQAADGGEWFIARTGYTGEDGFEVVLAEEGALALWNALLDAGVKPAGLGARDTLRLEAGMNLYGQDMDEDVSPYEAALGWTVSLDEGRDFIGREAIQAQAKAPPRRMIGIVMDDKGVLRHGQKVLSEAGEGEILSGTFSPTLGKAIGFARIPAGEAGALRVDIRGREVPLRAVKFPFVRDGKAQDGI